MATVAIHAPKASSPRRLQPLGRSKHSVKCTSSSGLPLPRLGRDHHQRGVSTYSEERLARLVCRAQKKQYGSFDEMVQEADKPILIDFNAAWCGPCRVMSEVLVRLRKDDAIRSAVDFVKIDTDKYPAISSRYGVSALPTLVLFIDGKEADRFEGVLSDADLKQRLLYFIQARKSQQA